MKIDDVQKFISRYNLQIQAGEWLTTIEEENRSDELLFYNI